MFTSIIETVQLKIWTFLGMRSLILHNFIFPLAYFSVM